MAELPSELVQAIQAGDCVLWAGAGFGSLAGRPGWNDLLSALVEECEPAVHEQLSDLLEQGRLRTVLSYIHRHKGDAPLSALLQKVSEASGATTMAPGAAGLAALPWRAVFATTYADVVWEIFRNSGKSLDVFAHVDVHDLSLRTQKDAFILRTPPTGRSMRADRVFYELVEEVVRTRTILFLGFDIDDPDLYQILGLLDRVGRGRRHYAWLPYVTQAEAEELVEQYGIEVIHADEDIELAACFEQLSVAVQKTAPRPSGAEGDLVALDLARALTSVDIRADLAVDDALTCDLAEIERLIAALPGGSIGAAEPRTQLRAGSVLLAHGKVADARRCFQQVVSRGAGREYESIARFNLALAAASEGDGAAAVEGLVAGAEAQRTLALVPPRFEVLDVLGRDGSRVMLACRDRGTGEQFDIAVTTLGRPASAGEQRRFYDEIQRLVEVDHPSVKRYRGAFADGRLFGVMSEKAPGFVLENVLEQGGGPASLEKAFEILGPLMDGIAVCHERNICHRNISPRQILMTSGGAMLRGFGSPPVIAFSRPSIVRSNLGYAAPELLAGAEPSAASDVYSLAAVLYRCVTGRPPAGGAPPPTHLCPDLDPRLDALLEQALHPDPSQRPAPRQFRAAVATILTTPRPRTDVEPRSIAASAPLAPAPMPETLTPPSGLSIELPSDPDDLEAWAWILERKPNHMEARAALERIEGTSRAAGRWDRVADVLNLRAQLAQAQADRIALLRELSGVFEHQLGAPGNAFETLQTVLDELSNAGQLEIIDDLLRLGGVTGRWSELAECVATAANGAVDEAERARLGLSLGRIYADELAAPDRAIACYEAVSQMRPEDPDTLRLLLDLYRRCDRKAELATALLSLAEMEEGGVRVDDLIEAAELLSGELGEQEGALETIEAALLDDPENERALALAEDLARQLERWPTVVQVLVRRAQLAFDEAEVSALRRQAADIYIERLADEAAGLEQLRKLVERDRGDAVSTSRLIDLLRKRVAADPTLREPLIDALYVRMEQVDSEPERMGLLVECAEHLDAEPDGAERAADCREQIVAALPGTDPVAKRAMKGLEEWYERQGAHHQLSELYLSAASADGLDATTKAGLWAKLLRLRQGPLDDREGAREALEALMELEPGEARWRDQALEAYLETGDDAAASRLIDAQIKTAQTPAEKVALLVNLGKLRLRAGDHHEAESALAEAVTIDDKQPRAWAALQELYDTTQQPMKALDAQVKAAETTDNPVERTRRLFDAARMCVEVLGVKERGVSLLERVVETDPDHREATRMLLDALVEAGDLGRAWPIAQSFVLQARAQAPDDIELNLHALSLAGRCALEANEREKAREYLARAKSLDAGNLEVVRALADLDMDAGDWNAALKGYQSVALSASGSLGAKDQAELYLRMGRARAGMGEPAKAVQMVERALDIDPDHEPAARALVELVGETRPADRVRAKVRLAELRGRVADAADGDAAAQARAEQVALLRDAADVLAGQLNRPEEATGYLERLLELCPGDPAILHQMLDLYTTAKKWREATELLSRLADLQPMADARAKYLYAGAILQRDHIRDSRQTREWMRRVLEADPLHDRAFRAAVEMDHEAGAWKDLSKVLRARLKALPEDANPEERVLLLDQIGGLYEEKLGDPKTAMAAFEQSIALAPADTDADRQVERRRKVIQLATGLGDAVDKAIEQTQALVLTRPMEFESYHRLVELYQRSGARDASMCVARALRFLKQATPEEQELAAKGDGTFAQARGTVTRELWRQCLYHPLETPRLSDLFSLIWHVVAAREGQTHAHFGVARKDRAQISLQSSGVARFVAYACQVLDNPVPDFLERKDAAGGFVVAALAGDNMVYPSLLAGADALAKQPDPALAFRAGRAVAGVQPEHILASVLRSAASLRDAVYGAVAVGQPDAAIPAETKERASAYAELIKRHVPPARVDTLRALTARVVESGGVDTKAWLQGVDHTTTRVGFLLSDSLEVSARILSQAGTEGAHVPVKDLIKDLVAFSVSEGYFRVRATLKLGR